MIHFRFEPACPLRIARFEGGVEDAELAAVYRRLIHASDYDPDLDELVDLRAVQRFAVTAGGLRGWIDLCQARRGRRRRRRALLAGSPLTYGMSRMFESLTTDDAPERVRAFLELAEARAWLELPAAVDAA